MSKVIRTLAKILPTHWRHYTLSDWAFVIPLYISWALLVPALVTMRVEFVLCAALVALVALWTVRHV